MLNTPSDGIAVAPALVNIQGILLQPVVVDGVKYTTFAQIDQVHGRPAGTAARTFRLNRNRFIDGKDSRPTLYVDLQKSGVKDPNPNGMVLLTGSGYFKIVKTFRDDLAWEIYEEMIERFFLVEAQVQTPVVDLDDTETLQKMLLAHMSDKLALKKENLALTGAVAEKDAKLAVLQPQAAEFERFMAAGNAATAEDFFKRMESRGYEVGTVRGFKWLREIGVVQQSPSVLPYQKHLNHRPKRFITHTVTTKLKNGKTRNDEQMLITPEGRVWLARRFEETYEKKSR